MFLYWHISPVIPRRHTHLLGELVDTIDRTTLITAGNHQLRTNGLDDILLRLTFQCCQHPLFHPLVDLSVHTNGAYQHLWLTVSQSGSLTGHLPKIRQEVFRRQLHTAMLTLSHRDGEPLQLPSIGRRLKRNKLVGSHHA